METKTITKKGTWESINKLKDLLMCPICKKDNLNYYKSSKTRAHKSCTCGCKIYEKKDNIWFTIPENNKINIIEDKDKFLKYMDQSKN
jgi:uncharacterized protein YbaR (Trm112 family)